MLVTSRNTTLLRIKNLKLPGKFRIKNNVRGLLRNCSMLCCCVIRTVLFWMR